MTLPSFLGGSFAYPLFLLAPFVIGAAAFFTRPRTVRAAPFPALGTLQSLPESWRQRLRLPVLGSLLTTAIVSLSIAAARPQRTTTVETPSESRSLILALDISRSMATRDFEGSFGHGTITRLEGVKGVVRRFIEERRDERLGLIVFGSSAYVQAPLTRDHNVVAELVSRLEVGMAGDGTAMGDGLGLSLKRIADIPAPSKAVVLLTDGVSNSGQVNPLKAAAVAAELGVKVYTIGIGGGASDPRSMGRTGAEFDEATLKEVARLTGGLYLNASSVEGLQDVYREIDRLETSRFEEPERRIVEELFPEFLWAALISYVGYAALGASVFRRLP
jgi:Ca-activated chloride channel family protein